MSEALITLDELAVGYHRKPILPALSLSIAPTQIWALMGRNGSGKSTLMRTMLELLPPVSGTVHKRVDLRLSYVPQRGDYDLSVPSRVIDLVRGGVDQGWSFLNPLYVRRAEASVVEAMARCTITGLAHRQFSALSEGQKQRVLIARALVSKPNLIVLDEPTSAMDPIAELEIFELLKGQLRYGTAVLIASHQMSFAPRFATHGILVDSEDGVAIAGEVQDITRHPAFLKKYGAVLESAEQAHASRGANAS